MSKENQVRNLHCPRTTIGRLWSTKFCHVQGRPYVSVSKEVLYHAFEKIPLCLPCQKMSIHVQGRLCLHTSLDMVEHCIPCSAMPNKVCLFYYVQGRLWVPSRPTRNAYFIMFKEDCVLLCSKKTMCSRVQVRQCGIPCQRRISVLPSVLLLLLLLLFLKPVFCLI